MFTASRFIVTALIAYPKIIKDFFCVFFVAYMVSLLTFKISNPFGILPSICGEYANPKIFIKFPLSGFATY